MVRPRKRQAEVESCDSEILKNTSKKPRTRSASSKGQLKAERNDGSTEGIASKPSSKTKRSLKSNEKKQDTGGNQLKKRSIKGVEKEDSGYEGSSFNSTDSGISSDAAEKKCKVTKNATTRTRQNQNRSSEASKTKNSATFKRAKAAPKSKEKKEDLTSVKEESKKTKVVPKIEEVNDKAGSSEEEFDAVENVSSSARPNLVTDAMQVSMDSDTAKLLEQCEPKLIAEALSSLKREDASCDSSGSESDWEEVEENEDQLLADYKPNIPKEGVEITIDCPELNVRKRKKKQFDEMEYIRLYINRSRKEVQMNVHKTHLLCLLAHGFYVNDLLNSPLLKGIALSLIPGDILSITSGKKVDKIDSIGIENIAKWFRSLFEYEVQKDLFANISESLVDAISTQKVLNASEYNLVFVVVARALGFKTRFCVSLHPMSHKAQNLIKKPSEKRAPKKLQEKDTKTEVKVEDNKKAGPSKTKEKKKSSEREQKAKGKPSKLPPDIKEKATPRSKRTSTKKKSYKLSSDESDDNSKDATFCARGSDSEDFEEPKPKRTNTPQRRTNRKVVSTDSEPSTPEHSAFSSDQILCWAEVFSKPDKQWVCVDCVNNLVNKPYDVERKTLQPVRYILAYDDCGYVKDVTRRYCSEYMTSTVKLRPDSDWWDESLEPFLPPDSKVNKDEEKDLESILINKPLPTTVAGYKNHPLYALKRHLLKFEAVYPPDAAPVGFMRGEPVYARDNVVQLHSRETWLKEARVVRIGEEPYKIVKARPKWDRITGVMRTDIPLDIFGFWQTEPYEPPVAVDGKVPRNEYGNVELFKPCMLPRGTVHLQISGLNRIAKKLGIDCCAAVVGFDGHKGSVHPVFDGFIVCEEFKDTLLAAWDEEQENAKKREEEKREKRIYGNWRKLIRGLLIRERIKLKYDTK